MTGVSNEAMSAMRHDYQTGPKVRRPASILMPITQQHMNICAMKGLMLESNKTMEEVLYQPCVYRAKMFKKECEIAHVITRARSRWIRAQARSFALKRCIRIRKMHSNGMSIIVCVCPPVYLPPPSLPPSQ